jgi:hypothetical protein
MSWSKKYKKSIDCDNPQGFSQKAHCAARKKRAKGEETKSKSPFNEMHEIKSHKTVEQIAKKHRLEVSFVKRQLEMGIPIEHEHTRDKDLATDIALQHLDEIPDYYTRLKKMEIDAKKHHKKFKDVKEATDGIGASSPKYSLHRWFDDGGWVQAGGKYDGKPCAKQPGQTTKPFCRDPDDRKNMSKEERNKRSAKKRREDPNPNRSGAAKIVTKEEYIQEKKGEKDACYHKVKSRYKIWPSAYASGALVKCRKVGADNWGTKSEEAIIDEAKKCWKGYKKEGTQTLFGKTYNRCVKANEETEMIRYCPKCQKDETRSECKYGPKYWDMFSIPSALTTNQLKYNIATVHPGNFPESYDHEYSMARSELSTIISAAKRLRKKMKGEGNIEAWVQSKITKAADYIDTAADYVDSGEMKSESVESGPILPKERGKRIFPKGQEPKPTGAKLPPLQNAHYELEGDLVEYSNWRADFGLSEDWQKVNRQDKTDGLSPAAVKAYRRENPGSKLQTAVTEKNPKGKRAGRRKNFCSRMKGMKDKLTSAETARDPDSRINKALRRWRCR